MRRPRGEEGPAGNKTNRADREWDERRQSGARDGCELHRRYAAESYPQPGANARGNSGRIFAPAPEPPGPLSCRRRVDPRVRCSSPSPTGTAGATFLPSARPTSGSDLSGPRTLALSELSGTTNHPRRCAAVSASPARRSGANSIEHTRRARHRPARSAPHFPSRCAGRRDRRNGREPSIGPSLPHPPRVRQTGDVFSPCWSARDVCDRHARHRRSPRN